MSHHVITSLEKTFDYYANFEDYEKRYPTYCQRIEIKDRKDRCIITREIWNMTINMEFDHVTITVKYDLIPYKEIKYEAIDGFGTGQVKSSITFEKRPDGFTQIEGNLIPFEIFAGLVKSSNHPLVQDMDSYFTWRDMRFLEGKSTPNFPGDPCPFCNDGILGYSHKEQDGDVESSRMYQTKFFICDKCEKTLRNFFVHSNERRERS